MAPPQTLTLASLPETIIIEEILSRLSLADAVRTSVLSRSWRRLWQYIPELHLCNLTVRVASQILFLHSGTIGVLVAEAAGDDSTVHCWLASLSRRGSDSTLQTLVLQDFSCNLYSIDGYFPNLTVVRLSGGCQRLPRDYYSGFKDLRILELSSIIFYGKISMLFSACPLLEKAFLIDIDLDEMQLVNIDDAPNLRELWFFDISNFIEYVLTSAPLLDKFLFFMQSQYDGTGGGHSEKVVSLFGGMPRVERLELNKGALKYLVDGNIPTSLPTSFDHLKYLCLEVNLGCVSQVLLALCLLRSCPNLQKLKCREIVRYRGEVSVGLDFWKAHDDGVVLNKLATIKVAVIMGVRAELDFIQFVLAKAQSLKTMFVHFIEHDSEHKELRMSEILEFPKISNQAQIIFKSINL